MTAFCALNRDAATAYRKKHPDLARELAARAAKLESGAAAKRLAELARQDTPSHIGELNLEGIYTRIANTRPSPADELARSISTIRRSFKAPLSDIGVTTIVGTLIRLDEESAEITSSDGEPYTLPVIALPSGKLRVGAPVSVRMELLGDGVISTVVEPAWSDSPTERPHDQFGDLRPQLPANLDELLDRNPPRPLALIGPRLAWR